MPELPQRPSLEHLRKQAKARTRERAIALSQAQHELARDITDCAFDDDGPTPLDCALWGLRNNHADDGDYPGTVQALFAAGAPTRLSPPTGDEAIDALLTGAGG